jgi:hypothetical protein
MRFRRIPTIIEAEQFHHPATAPRGVRTEEDGRAYVITAHEQKVYLEPGDWIVPEPGKEDRYYPIKPNIFEATYKPEVEPPSESFWSPEDPRWEGRVK